MKSPIVLVVAMLVLWPVCSRAESRFGPKTIAQLTNESTLVFEGIVSGVVTVQEYEVAFPNKAEVAKVVKGTWGQNTIEFKHKSPGKYVIFPAEYNSPAIRQRGTFFLQDQGGTPILIGYIKKEAEPPQRFTLIWRETSVTPIEKVETPKGFEISPAKAVEPLMARSSRAPWAEFYLFVDATSYYFGSTRSGTELTAPEPGHWIINGATGKTTYSESENTKPSVPYAGQAGSGER